MANSLSLKNNEILAVTMTWVDLKVIMLSEVCQTEKDEYHRFHLDANLRNKKSKLIKTEPQL